MQPWFLASDTATVGEMACWERRLEKPERDPRGGHTGWYRVQQERIRG